MKTWPERVRSLREHWGDTQEQFAQRIGTTWATISRWENGRAEPTGLYARAVEEWEEEASK